MCSSILLPPPCCHDVVHHPSFSCLLWSPVLLNSCTAAVVQVARRKGGDGKLLSMGFGFVEVDSEEAAKAVTQQLQVGAGSARKALGTWSCFASV